MSTIYLHTHWQLPPVGSDEITGLNDVHQCICNILNTRKGSDVLRPEFGSNHFDYLDQPFDVAVPNMVREIFEAIKRWEKRVILQKVEVSGQAPHFTFTLHWQVADEVAGEVYQTELKQ